MDTIGTALKGLATAFFAMLVLVTTLAVFSRYALNFSLVWAEEFGRYLFVWIVCIGATVAVARGAHVSVDFLVEVLSPRVRAIFAVISEIGVAIFLVVMTYYGAQLTLFGLNSYSLAMGMPMALAYAALPFSGLLMLGFTVGRLVSQIKALRGS